MRTAVILARNVISIRLKTQNEEIEARCRNVTWRDERRVRNARRHVRLQEFKTFRNAFKSPLRKAIRFRLDHESNEWRPEDDRALVHRSRVTDIAAVPSPRLIHQDCKWNERYLHRAVAKLKLLALSETVDIVCHMYIIVWWSIKYDFIFYYMMIGKIWFYYLTFN